jgi:hypothetical protein
LSSDQHDLVTNGDGVIAHINHQLIHRDYSNDRTTASTNQDLSTNSRQSSWNAIGITQWNSCYRRGIFKMVTLTIRNTLASRHSFDK